MNHDTRYQLRFFGLFTIEIGFRDWFPRLVSEIGFRDFSPMRVIGPFIFLNYLRKKCLLLVSFLCVFTSIFPLLFLILLRFGLSLYISFLTFYTLYPSFLNRTSDPILLLLHHFLFLLFFLINSLV